MVVSITFQFHNSTVYKRSLAGCQPDGSVNREAAGRFVLIRGRPESWRRSQTTLRRILDVLVLVLEKVLVVVVPVRRTGTAATGIDATFGPDLLPDEGLTRLDRATASSAVRRRRRGHLGGAAPTPLPHQPASATDTRFP